MFHLSQNLTDVVDEPLDFCLHAPVTEFNLTQLVRTHQRFTVGRRLTFALHLQINTRHFLYTSQCAIKVTSLQYSSSQLSLRGPLPDFSER